MKKNISLFTICLSFFMAAQAQSTYTTIVDPKDANGFIYNGVFSKYALINQPAFTWYNSSQTGYTSPAPIVTAMTEAKDKVTYMIFGGTWCSDTQFVLPKFFKLQEAAGVADNKISFIGVDREKKSIGNVATVFGITNVPTIIVLKDGKEVGRVVEYGKTGKWDQELADLIK